MWNKIIDLMREYVFGLSLITIVIGLLIFLPSVMHYILPDNIEPILIKGLGDWNFYLLIIGLIVFGVGISYLYNYIKNKRFILSEIDTNKRSEFIKRHSDLKNATRHMPNKYKDMIKEKEKELKIK